MKQTITRRQFLKKAGLVAVGSIAIKNSNKTNNHPQTRVRIYCHNLEGNSFAEPFKTGDCRDTYFCASAMMMSAIIGYEGLTPLNKLNNNV